MRAIVKPKVPDLDDTSAAGMARALGNAVGRFCSFCEKVLNYRLLLFHKGRGVLPGDVPLTPKDWPEVLLICGDCAASIDTFNPLQAYFWPDTDAAKEAPFLYTMKANVTEIAKAPQVGIINQQTISLILVQVSTDVSLEVHAAARRTYQLFHLNGRFFCEDFERLKYKLPYEEYVAPTDMRLRQRWDAHLRAKTAAAAIVRGMRTLNVDRGYLDILLAMIGGTVDQFGFVSTWQATIAAELRAADPALYPRYLAFITGQDEPPLDRKRAVEESEKGLAEAPQRADLKRRAIGSGLSQLLKVES